jgi:hypothetical protein
MIPWELGDTVRQGRNLRDRIVASKPTWNGNTPQGVSDVWQTLGLETVVFGSVAILGLTGEFADVWQIKKLGDRGGGQQGLGRRENREIGEDGTWQTQDKDSMGESTG